MSAHILCEFQRAICFWPSARAGVSRFSLTNGRKYVILIAKMEEFVPLPEVLRPSGVYLLLRHQAVVYVGKSKNLFARLSAHRNNMLRSMKGLPVYAREASEVVIFDDVRVKFCAVDMLDKEEVVLIQRYLPQHNGHHNVPRYDLSNLPAFQELLKKARRHRTPTYARLPLTQIARYRWSPPQPIYPPLKPYVPPREPKLGGTNR